MNSILTKFAALLMFILAVMTGWAAVYMVFEINLWNIILGIICVFFILRALELVDHINKYGDYNPDKNTKPNSPHHGPRFGEGKPGDDSPEEETEQES